MRQPPAIFARQIIAANFERYMQLLREYAPWGWHPEIEVRGVQHLIEAQNRGRGVVLYVYPTIFYYIVVKKGLHAARIRMDHLSRAGHGFSHTVFGMKYLNPLMTRIEDRYLEHRYTMTPDSAVRGIRPVIEALRRARTVSITANAEGQCHEIPFLGGVLRLARGAASLALSNAAPLVPVSVVRSRPGHYVIEVSPALPWPNPALPPAAREQALLQAYGLVIEQVVERNPFDWPDWLNRARWRPGQDAT